MGLVVRLDACGLGEGYAPQGMAEKIAKRLHDPSLEPDYVGADEPISFTHHNPAPVGGKPNCMYPLPVVADRVALSFAAMHAYFPHLQLGIGEVMARDPKLPAEQRIGAYVQFMRLVSARIHQKIAYFHTDITWSSDPIANIAPLGAAIKAEGIPFGAIIGDGPKDQTDQAWVQDGMQRLDFLMKNPATRLDDLVVQSWQPRPKLDLPETTPGTLTNLLLRSERQAALYH